MYQRLSLLQTLLLQSLVLFFLGVSISLQAQSFKKGYVVTNENDTLRGFVKNKDFSTSRLLERIKYKKTAEGGEQAFSPNQLKSFMIGIDSYVSRKTSLIDGVEQNVFMQVMAQGYLSYFQFEHTGLNSRSTYLTVDNIERFAILQKQGENVQFVVQN